MTYAGDIHNELQEIFHRYKEKQKLGLLTALNDVRGSNYNHKTRLRNCKMIQTSPMCFRIAIVIIILMCLAIFTIWCLRQYVNKNIFGGSGLCSNSYLWPFTECPVVF